MSRITSEKMTLLELMGALAGSNRGAGLIVSQLPAIAGQLSTLAQNRGGPDCHGGAFSPLLGLDSNGIYEADIWVLHKDVCGEDIFATYACIKARQADSISKEALKRAIEEQSDDALPAGWKEEAYAEIPHYENDIKTVQMPAPGPRPASFRP